MLLLLRTMEKRVLLQDDGHTQAAKEICIMQDAQKLKLILGKLTWKILTMLSEEEKYPLEIARQLGIHEQIVYYHIRKLAKGGTGLGSRCPGGGLPGGSFLTGGESCGGRISLFCCIVFF